MVSQVAGTTRDTIEETANIRGLPVVFVDTAGLRTAGDAIEAEGVRRSHAALEKADLVLHVFDNAEPLTATDERYLRELAGRKRIVVCNKMDLLARLQLPPDTSPPIVAVCCLSGAGLETLKDTIKTLIWAGEIKAEMLQVMINSRHQAALQRARSATEKAGTALRQNLPLELVAMDLHIAVNAIGEIVGKTATEDLLDAIFSQFCIGK
jgi:tRNA modification GTPase